MKLQPLTLEQCQTVRLWRNECLETLRTPYPLTEEMQADFYHDVICNRNSPHRYWGIEGEYELSARPGEALAIKGKHLGFMGMGGLTNIQWENRNAEISLILDPKIRGKGYGEQAVDLLLEEAFHWMNLNCVYGECYSLNAALGFWDSIVDKYGGRRATLRARKFWGGEYWNSTYFDILREEYEKCKTSQTE